MANQKCMTCFAPTPKTMSTPFADQNFPGLLLPAAQDSAQPHTS
jgi:hypothetical protein